MRRSPCAAGTQRGGFVRRVLQGLSAADSSDLKSALDNPAIEHTAIAKGVAVALGIKLATSSVGRHRKGECSCQ